MGQAVVRWVALGSWIQVLALLPGFGGLLGLVSLVWAVVLLVTTVSSPTKQGLHDRFAGSAIVQPIGRDGPVIPCLILLVLLVVVLPFIFVLGLIAWARSSPRSCPRSAPPSECRSAGRLAG